jgi:hypothetical protein
MVYNLNGYRGASMSDEAEIAPKATKRTNAAKKRVKTTAKAKKAAKDVSSAKGKPWTFPKNALEDAIRIPKEIEEKNAGNPMPAPDLAVAVGFRLPNDWRFQDLLRSADQYGLVERTGGNVSLTKLGQDVVAPSSPSQRSEALLTAFRSVKDFEGKRFRMKRFPGRHRQTKFQHPRLQESRGSENFSIRAL